MKFRLDGEILRDELGCRKATIEEVELFKQRDELLAALELMRESQYVMNTEKLYGRNHLMVPAAFLYCLGRMTYIVSECADWIIANWNDWPENTRNIIKRELEEAFKRDDEAREDGRECKPLGGDCDRQQWERVRSLWQ